VIIPIPYRLLAGAALIAAAWAHGHHVASAAGGAQITAIRAEYAQAAASASEAYRAEEQRRADTTQEIAHVAQIARDHAAADARRADDAHISLLDAARQATRGDPAPGNTCPADPGPARPTAAPVLADVLGGIDEAAGILAAALDRATAAGRACEQWADELRDKQ
jgi:Protein of unknown function (DUF2514)